MALLLLSIGSLENIIDLLVNVLNPFNKFIVLVSLGLSMGIFSFLDARGDAT